MSYKDLQPYLMMDGCADAIEFYKRAFDATEKMRMADPDSGHVHHAEITIGDNVVCMADENIAVEAYAVKHYGGSPASLLLYVDDCDAVYRRAIDAGATSVREPKDESYGDRMSGVRDPFGYRWWIATPIPPK